MAPGGSARARSARAAIGLAGGVVPVGAGPVAARARGMAIWNGSVEVVEGRESSITIDLVPGVVLEGTVSDALGKPLQDAHVMIGDRYSQGFGSANAWT